MDKLLAVIMVGGRGERLSILSQERAKPAVPFAGKYRIMDYRSMLEIHQAKRPDVPLAVTPIPEEELFRFGTVVVNKKGRVIKFQEKIRKPESNLASMGVYIFKKELLRNWLQTTTEDDFGRDIFPKMAEKGRIYTHVYDDYWRDIGTV